MVNIYNKIQTTSKLWRVFLSASGRNWQNDEGHAAEVWHTKADCQLGPRHVPRLRSRTSQSICWCCAQAFRRYQSSKGVMSPVFRFLLWSSQQSRFYVQGFKTKIDSIFFVKMSICWAWKLWVFLLGEELFKCFVGRENECCCWAWKYMSGREEKFSASGMLNKKRVWADPCVFCVRYEIGSGCTAEPQRQVTKKTQVLLTWHFQLWARKLSSVKRRLLCVQ